MRFYTLWSRYAQQPLHRFAVPSQLRWGGMTWGRYPSKPHPMPLPRTFRVKSFGCQMNVYDGERMGELLLADGLTPAAEGEQAELTVLNTCHIRDKATEKVYSDIGPAGQGGPAHRRAGP